MGFVWLLFCGFCGLHSAVPLDVVGLVVCVVGWFRVLGVVFGWWCGLVSGLGFDSVLSCGGC